MHSFKPLRVLAVATGLFVLVLGGIDLIADRHGRLYGFVNERGFVQPTEIYVACVVAALLWGRFRQWRNNRLQLGLVDGASDAPLPEARRAADAVCATREAHGSVAAVAHAERLADESRQGLHRSYAMINYLAGMLPALGLFGTMLGLSNGLFAAFSGGTMGPDAVKQFVSSLAVAMDTTVLAMVLAAPLFAVAWLLERTERDLIDRWHQRLRAELGLDHTADADPTVDALRTELRSLAGGIASEANACFQKALQSSAAAYRDSLHEAVKDIFDAERARDRKAVQSLAVEIAKGLARSLEALVQETESLNRRLADEVTAQMGQLAQALRSRTPEEVIIRYQHNASAGNNGRGHHGELIHVAN
jgi:biopolymer transport protein ExbB/TolQ